MKQKLPKIIVALVLFLVIGGSVGAAGYFYTRYEKVKKNPDLVSKEEVKTVTDSIAKYMELPSDEQPTLATVTDKEKLKDQDFFKKAQNGDKILIYANARKAILYRPSTGKVIEFAPLLIGDGSDQSAEPSDSPQAQTQTTPITVAIYNGTDLSGFTTEVENKLAGVSDLSVISKLNAAKNDYSQSLVLDLSGKYDQVAQDIASRIDGELTSTLPDGESWPSADILIIAGKE